MIIYYMGLPGSGKTHGVVKDYILEALKAGRKVYAYIEGLNHLKFAQILSMNLEDVQRLLIQLTREQAAEWWKHVENDSLVIIDEAQNFWPSGKASLPPEPTKAFSEHRHNGLDIILMGQDSRDCHNLIKRRIDQRVIFSKLDSIGLPNHYSYIVQKALAPEKFEEVSSSGSRPIPYDKEVFGAYLSHVEGVGNKKTFKDDRAVVWKKPYIKYGVPIALVMVISGLSSIYDFFVHPKIGMKPQANIVAPSAPSFNAVVPVRESLPPASVKKPEEPKEMLHSETPIEAPQDRVQMLSKKYRLRVGGYWEGRGKRNGYIEWRSDGGALVNRFTFDEMAGFGYTVMANQFGTVVTIVNGPVHYVATMWPLDFDKGVASQRALDQSGRNLSGNSNSNQSQGQSRFDFAPNDGIRPFDYNEAPFPELPRASDYSNAPSLSAGENRTNPTIRSNVQKFNESQRPASSANIQTGSPPALNFR